MNLYFLPSLGADERLFEKLNLECYNPRCLHYFLPENNDSLGYYAKRLIEQIEPKENLVLIGCSLGGILAQEIAKQIPVKKVILISSVKSHKELDWRFAFLRITKLYKLFPYSLAKGRRSIIMNYFMGLETADKELFYSMLKRTDWRFSKWAVKQVLHWENTQPKGCVRIHGKDDKLFKIDKINAEYTIKNAGHFLIVNRADELSRIILNILK